MRIGNSFNKSTLTNIANIGVTIGVTYESNINI